MKTFFRWLGVVAITVAMFGATAEAAPTDKQGSAAARALTEITGIAISPLLGVSVVGAYNYFTTPAEKKDSLPWYSNLKFWLPALLLVLVVAVKDTAGAILPPGLKKPLDVAETVESKVSGLVAAGAVVPSIAAIFHSTVMTSSGAPDVTQAGILAVNFAPLLNILMIPLAVTMFVLVWLVGHVINVMILISPWGGFDAVLKGVRTALLGALTAIHYINPWVGALISLGIVVIAYFLAGWSFRMMVFGSVFTWDFFTVRRRRFKPAANGNWMFTARKFEKTPVRTYGKLVRTEDGKLTFQYRPWLVFQQKTVSLPEEKLAVGRGLFYPEIVTVKEDKTKSLLAMPPRYKKHEEEISQIYGINDVRDTGMLKGIKAVWRWFTRNLFGRDSQEAAAAGATA